MLFPWWLWAISLDLVSDDIVLIETDGSLNFSLHNRVFAGKTGSMIIAAYNCYVFDLVPDQSVPNQIDCALEALKEVLLSGNNGL